ncbi:MAG: hypothetical protein U0457_14635 [Candidatus Sericytochromatia bacterium]
MKKKYLIFTFIISLFLFYSNLAFSEDLNKKEIKTSNIKLLLSKKRILHIGDSHTVGFYGREMDELLRNSGAIVRTYGSSGSSPSWWFNEKETKSGFYSKDENNNVYDPIIWKTPHKTPKIEALINEFKPEIIIVSLGANLLNQNEITIKKEVNDICKFITEKNIKLIWVGPPNGRKDKKPIEKQNFLYDNIKPIVKNYGSFIDSRDYTYYPETLKGDGVHFGGKDGKIIAQKWAKKVFEEIVKITQNE